MELKFLALKTSLRGLLCSTDSGAKFVEVNLQMPVSDSEVEVR